MDYLRVFAHLSGIGITARPSPVGARMVADGRSFLGMACVISRFPSLRSPRLCWRSIFLGDACSICSLTVALVRSWRFGRKGPCNSLLLRLLGCRSSGIFVIMVPI